MTRSMLVTRWQVGGPRSADRFSFGALYQALHAIKFTGVKFHATASGAAPSTWTVKGVGQWVSGCFWDSACLRGRVLLGAFGTTNGVGALTPYTCRARGFCHYQR